MGTHSNKRFSTINLYVNRGSRSVVNNLSFQIEIGTLVGVLGANGAGKSTLLSVLAGECSVNSGSVCINGVSLSTLTALEQAQLRAVLPQHSSLSFNLSVIEIVTMGAYSYPEAQPQLLNRWVVESLHDTDLSHLTDVNYTELSGGQQQRVHLARVLVQSRAIAHFHGHAWILLDEPTSSLDPRHQQLLFQKIHALTRAENFGVMVVMHDLNLAALWCDRLMLMKEGALIFDDCPANTLTSNNLLECFDNPMHVFPHPIYSDKVCVVAHK